MLLRKQLVSPARGTKPPQPFSKELLGEYRATLLEQKLSASTINLRLSPLQLAREIADNGLLGPGAASTIKRTKAVKQQGMRAGNWLLREQANAERQAPRPLPITPDELRSLWQFYRRFQCIWREWLSRRTRGKLLTWEKFAEILRQYPELRPRITHSWAGTGSYA